ncbi:KAP family P-loop NTPase fold protein [Rhizobium leguminosarum]|uniref:KAP family P-loop NTPase fold protein n=1 Tax=Rhizobium leguminosarum TaxID=384 RepID=UPI003F9DA89E
MVSWRWFKRNSGKLADARSAAINDTDIGADVPIRQASQDLLRRVSFADRIAEILSQLTLEEGRIFAIRGEWGAGKSSLKNLIVESLQNREKGASWLEFNPWQWGDGDAIAKALFKEIADKLGGDLSSAAGKRAGMFRRYGALLTGTGASIKAVGNNRLLISSLLANASVVALVASFGLDMPKATTVAAAFAISSFLVPLIGKAMVAWGKDRWAEPLDSIRSSLEGSLRELEKPLVVFVDDIDRLEPDQIRLLIRQIKVNANLPNIVFVLLFQPSIVEAALDEIADGQGREFLKKIIQANFDLPAVPRPMVSDAMVSDLSRLANAYSTKENGFEEVRWGNTLFGVIQPFIANLRDAKRFVSSVAIHLPLHVGEPLLEVNIIDFLALEALRVFEPDFHSSLFVERNLLLQSARHDSDGQDQEQKARLDNLIARVSERNRPAVEAALTELFPRVAWAFGGMYYDAGDWMSQWTSDRRVCSSRYFRRYFELQTPPGEMSDSEYGSFLTVSNDAIALEATINDIEERGLLGSLAFRLDDGVNRLPVESAATLMPQMFAIGQKLVDRGVGPLTSPWVAAWRAISWYIGRLPLAERGTLTIEALRQTGALSVGATIIHLNDPSDQRDGSKVEPKLDEETVAALKTEWLRQIRELAGGGDLDLHPDLGSLLYRWRDYAGGLDGPRAWVQEAIADDEGFLHVIERLMTTGTSHTVGDFVSSRVDSFDKRLLDDLIGEDVARDRLSKVDASRASDEQRRAITALRKTLDGNVDF